MPQDDTLLQKTQVNYRKGDDTASCGDCLHYLAPDKCELVSGTIAINALCDLFEDAGKDQEQSSGNGMDSLMEELFGAGGKEEDEKEQEEEK